MGSFTKDESEPKFYKEGQLFVNAIRKLLTSGIYTRSEAEDIFNRMTKISSDNKLQSKIVYNDNQNPAFQTEKGAKVFAPGAKIT